MVLNLFCAAINTAWAPIYYDLADTAEGRAKLPRLTTVYASVVTALAIGYTLVAPDLLLVLANRRFHAAVAVVPVVAAGYYFFALYMVVSTPIFHRKKTGWAPVISGAAALINVGVNLVLIPRYGMFGAAWATLIAYAFMFLIARVISERLDRGIYENRNLIVLIATYAISLAASHRPDRGPPADRLRPAGQGGAAAVPDRHPHPLQGDHGGRDARRAAPANRSGPPADRERRGRACGARGRRGGRLDRRHRLLARQPGPASAANGALGQGPAHARIVPHGRERGGGRHGAARATRTGSDMDLAGKRVLVTGADGFIGSHLSEALLEAGAQVRALALYNSFGTWGWLDTLPPETLAALEVVSGDVRDPYGVRTAVRATTWSSTSPR